MIAHTRDAVAFAILVVVAFTCLQIVLGASGAVIAVVAFATGSIHEHRRAVRSISEEVQRG